MKTPNRKTPNVSRLFTVFLLCSCVVFAASTDPIIQWPIPDPNGPRIGFQKRNGMFPEMAAHHAEMVGKLLKAVAADDYSAFIYRGTEQFQKADRSRFDVLVSEWRDRLKEESFKVTPMGELNRRYETSVWRVNFDMNGDEALIMLVTNKRGNIVNFRIL